MSLKMFKLAELNLAENFPVNCFFQAISIYLKKTQVINRKLSCSSNLTFIKIHLPPNVNKSDLAKHLAPCEYHPDAVRNTLKLLDVVFEESDVNILKDFDEAEDGVYLSIDRMVPRDIKKFKECVVATVIDRSESTAYFFALTDTNNLIPSIDFEICYFPKTKIVTLNIPESTTEESSNWLQFVLLKKIQNWMESCADHASQTQIDSHQLINSESYNDVYAELKEKYGKKLEDGWSESTDPKKFIYEDIAIASYLIVLWKQERYEGATKQSFVDLGCGNGLLVYILSQEGHRGYGIDLRRRKIWSRLPAETDLREATIVPSDEHLFSDVDWIIGNHSDELSPWIAVISARSSFDSKYFVLPCCAFEFSGAKFQRKLGSKSTYLSFVDYLLTVSEACGFATTKLDRLKIPSTKRICLIGSGRLYERSEFQLQCGKIQNFINQSNTQGNSGKWSEAFTPRDKIEVVKNCSKVEKTLSQSIVKRIFDHLISTEKTCEEFPGWNCGGQILIQEAVKLVSPEELRKLKSECGGLQTLLRNKSQVFHIYGGVVKIRIPKKLSEKVFSEKSKRRNVIKTCPCYFYHNHVCPLLEEDCSFIHSLML